MSNFIKEFRDFALKGNVIDMAVGVIIGGAFGKIVSSLVNDILMPALGILTGNVNFNEYKAVLREAYVDAAGEAIPEVAITWGAFVQAVFDFTLIALCIFMAIKAINRLRKQSEKEAAEEAAAPAGPSTEELLAEIRDLLAKKQADK